MSIKNLKDLKKVLEPYLVKALELTRDDIYDVFSKMLNDYYTEPVFNNPNDPTQPVVYKRTDKLRDSFTASEIIKFDGIYSFRVGYWDDYLTFRYPGNSKWKNNVPATGQDVLDWFNSGSHGGTVRGSFNFWDMGLDYIQTEYGGIQKMFISNCKKVGLNIH